MLSKEALNGINLICGRLGSSVKSISFQATTFIDNESLLLSPDTIDLTCICEENGVIKFLSSVRNIDVAWKFTPHKEGYRTTLSLSSQQSLNCSSMDSLIVSCRPESGDISEWWLPAIGADYFHVDMIKVKELKESERKWKVLAGVFRNSREQGLLLGTIIPQRNLHYYKAELFDEKTLLFTCTTSFTEGLSKSCSLVSEVTCVFADKDIKNSIEAYAEHLPYRTETESPPVGWNSWDYYFRGVSMKDVTENMHEIKKDPFLSEKIKYIVVDDGWQHIWGEWEANYKFPDGLKGIADEISGRGFVPGIWTAPIMVENLSLTALRNYKMLLKNEYGDPAESGVSGYYMIDPTHPEGREFIKKLFTDLYNTGFRLFKVDYVFWLLKAERFYDPEKGPYDAMRDLFKLIRECVTDESHIVGCSLPAETGQGYADSGRIAIDIHNHWSHVEWVYDSVQLAYWQHGRIWINDPDFLIVRGLDTSVEEETNVLNPNAHNPIQGKWRGGQVFNRDEALTWANVVALSGGSVFLSDRLSKLTAEGKKIIHKLLDPVGKPAVPLSLCDEKRASFCLQETEGGYRLYIINWDNEAREKVFKFEEYGLDSPKEVVDFWNGAKYPINGGLLVMKLKPHQSALVTYSKYKA